MGTVRLITPTLLKVPNTLPTTFVQPDLRNHPQRFNPPLPILLRRRSGLNYFLLGLGHTTRQLRVGRLELCEMGLQRCRFTSLEIGNTCCSVGICVKKETQ
jgi:hypothetical protein